MRFAILDGPVDASGQRWYRVRVAGLDGWASAGPIGGEPWLASVESGSIAFGVLTSNVTAMAVETMALDGSNRQHLADVDAYPQSASLLPAITCGSAVQIDWSPAGDWLAVRSSVGCDGVISAMNASGGGLTRVADGQTADWAPNGLTLAFDLNVPYCGGPTCAGGPWDLYSVSLPSGTPKQLTHGPDSEASAAPRWSPDGTLIAFSRWTGAVNQAFLAQSDGSSERLLTAGSPLVWVPDGSGLVINRYDPGQAQVLVTTDGSEQPSGSWIQQYSPDGSWLLLESPRDPGTGETSTVLSSWDRSVAITLPATWWTMGWTPDGHELLLLESDLAGTLALKALEMASGSVRAIAAFSTDELATFTDFAVQPILVPDLN